MTRRVVLGSAAALVGTPALALGPVVGETPIQVAPTGLWTGVWIEKRGPFRFSIASGVNSFAVLDELAERLELRRRPSDAIRRSGPDERPVNLYRAQEILVGGTLGLTLVDLAGIRADRPRATVGQLPLITDRVTAFDFANGVMRMTTDAPKDLSGYERLPLLHEESFLGWSPELICRYGGRKLRFGVSTSSGNALAIYPDAVRRLGLWDGPGPSFERWDHDGSTEFRRKITRRGDLELGGLTVKNPVVELHDPKISAFGRGGNDGHIGLELLRRMDVVVEQPRRLLWLRPRGAALEAPWRHDRSGFGFDYRDRAWRVVTVDEGGPAAKSGLSVGDLLTGTAEAIQRLDEARWEPPGTNLAFSVLRDGKPVRISITLEDRL